MNETAFLDQLGAAERDTRALFQLLSDRPGRRVAQVEPTPWLTAIVETVWAAPVRRARCKHARVMKSPAPLVLTIHARQIECLPCAFARARKTKGTLEDRRCDSCRALVPEGQVLTFALQVGVLIVLGGHCDACTPIVRGADA